MVGHLAIRAADLLAMVKYEVEEVEKVLEAATMKSLKFVSEIWNKLDLVGLVE